MITLAADLPASATPNGRPVDLVHLSRVTFGDRALEREVLGLFMRQSTIQLDRLKLARNAHAFSVAAHMLKGSALSIGARHVADTAAEAEALAERHEASATVEVLARLEARVAESHLYISQLLTGSQ